VSFTNESFLGFIVMSLRTRWRPSKQLGQDIVCEEFLPSGR
jgi:hypothetical protein